MSFNITNMCGGAVISMSGKNCFAIAGDKCLRFNGSVLMSTSYNRVHQVAPGRWVGFGGFAADGEQMLRDYKKEMKLFQLREGREMTGQEQLFSIGKLSYDNRTGSPYQGKPMAVYLDNGEVGIADQDGIGSFNVNHEIGTTGTGDEQFFGLLEKFQKPDMSEDDLFNTIANVFQLSSERNPLSGNGMVVYIVTENDVKIKKLETRSD